ncbi:MAG: AsmA family protein [Actinomycetota bacterium]
MKLSTAILGAAAAAVAGVVALIAAAKSIDGTHYKAFLAAQAKAATGRELTIEGPLKLKLGLVPRVMVEGISLANAPWAPREPMLRIERVEAEVALLPLLRREIQVRKLVLVMPHLLLQRDGTGRANWHLSGGQPAPARPQAAPATAFEIGEIAIDHGAVEIVDGGKPATRLAVDKVRLHPDRNGAAALSVAGSLQDAPFTVAGTVGPAAGRLKLQLKAEAAGTVLVADGAVADPLHGTGLDLTVGLHGDDLAALGRFAGLPLPALGPFKGGAHLADNALTAIDAAVGRREALLLTAKGEVRDLSGLRDVEMAVGAESDGKTGLPPLRLAGRLADVDGGWRLSDIKGSLAGGEVGGDLVLDQGRRPHLRGRIHGAGMTMPEGGRAQPRDGRLIPDLALPLAALDQIDADLDLALAKWGQVSDLAARLHLDRGRLRAEPVSARLSGGTVAASAGVDAATQAVTLHLDARGVDLGQLVDGVSGGRTDLLVDLKGRGAGLREVAARLNGTVVATVGEARLRGTAIDRAGADTATQLVGALDPFSSGNDATQVKCAAARLTVHDGVATADRGLAVETARTDVVGAGTIDLRNEALDLAVRPRPREGLGLSLGGKVAGVTRIRGTLAEPKVGIDELGAARAAASVGAAVATGGLSLLGELLLDKATADPHPCLTALGKAPRRATRGLLDGIFGR